MLNVGSYFKFKFKLNQIENKKKHFLQNHEKLVHRTFSELVRIVGKCVQVSL